MIYKSCDCIAHGIYFGTNSIWHCGNLVGRNHDEEALITNYKGENIDWKKIIELKRQKREEHKNGVVAECCKNCPQFVEKDWDEEDYINETIIAHFTKCNSNCSYCFTSKDKKGYNSLKEYKIINLLKDFEKSGYLKFDHKVIITGGEPTELREFDGIVDFFDKHNQNKFYIETNGIKHSRAIEKVLAKGRGIVTISVDCGTRETYKQIKNVDEYRRVCDTLKKYVKKTSPESLLISKYVIIPEVNDNLKEIDAWFDACKEIGIKNAAIDMESEFLSEYPRRIPEIIPELIKHIQERAENEGIAVSLFGNAQRMVDNLENGTFATMKENPVKREYFSCEDFLHTVSFMPDGLRHCMYLSPDNAPPVIPIFRDSVVNTDYVFECKHEIEEQKMEGMIQDDCKHCFKACKQVHDNRDFISKVLISHRKDCNAHCVYCYNQFDKKVTTGTYDILPQLKAFSPYFENGCEFHFGGGEPTIWEEFDDIIDFALNENITKICIATNGSRFSQKLADAVKAGKAQVVFTTDTANADIFRNLKGLSFDEVTENIKKYLEYDPTKEWLENKYIIIPNINDSEEAIKQWVEYNKNLGMKKLAIDIEAIFFSQNRENISDRLKKLVTYAEELIKSNDMYCNLYGFAQQMKYDDKK